MEHVRKTDYEDVGFFGAGPKQGKQHFDGGIALLGHFGVDILLKNIRLSVFCADAIHACVNTRFVDVRTI